MTFLNTIQINLFAITILLLIFINIKRSSRNILFDQKLFLSLVIIALSLLSIDIVRIYVNGKNTLFMRNTNLLFTAFSYALAPITSLVWAIYADYKIHENKMRIKKKLPILILPIIINISIMFLNLIPGRFYKSIFIISNANIYSRGPYLYIIMILSYGYLLYAFMEIRKNKELLETKDYNSLLVFILPPLIGSIIQATFYGVRLAWVNLTLSILIIYMNIQNKQLSLDPLTGLYNRRKLNMYLDSIIDRSKHNILGGIMIDLDDFKSINDTFGHREGDNALVHFSNILKENFKKDDFLARYGGDEFLIVMKINGTEEIKDVVKRLNHRVEKFNNDNLTPYKLSLSIGYDVFHSDSYLTSEEFVTRVDNLMYIEKKSKYLTP